MSLMTDWIISLSALFFVIVYTIEVIRKWNYRRKHKGKVIFKDEII